MGNSNVAQATTPRQAQFKLFSGALTPFDGKDGRLRLRTIASSSVEDLSGDIITPEALKGMAASAIGKTIFRNHSYKVPDDILGSVEKAEAKYAGTDEVGKPIWDLMLDVLVRNDPKSVETYKAVAEEGVQLGTSIGALIPVGGAAKGDNGGLVFSNLQFMEASIVGIPQNPRSWVQYATKAYKIAEATPGEDDDDTNEGFMEASVDPGDGIEKTGVEVPADGETHEVTLEPAEQMDKSARVWVNGADGKPQIVVETDDAPAEATAEKAGEPDLAKAACPDCGGYAGSAKGDCSNAMHKTAEPDIVKGVDADLDEKPSDDGEPVDPPATEADSDEPAEDSPAQELAKSVPESAQADALLSDTMAKGADVLADLVKNLTREVMATRADRDAAFITRDQALQEAKDAKANAEYAIGLVVQLANQPFGPKAVVTEAAAIIRDLRTKFGGIYSANVLKMLEKTDES